MNNEHRLSVYESLIQISKQLQYACGIKARLIEYYWSIMFHFNRTLEKLGYPFKLDICKSNVLNFGCGYSRTQAISSDLFAIHRYFMNKPRPDLYLTGTVAHKKLSCKFEAIVCEHVLEHVLPSQAHTLLKILLEYLKPGGVIQISVPCLTRFIAYDNGQINMNIISINDIAYRYGHRFLHDAHTISALLESVGFEQIEMNSYHTSHYRDYLSINREPQSIYFIAKRPVS